MLYFLNDKYWTCVHLLCPLGHIHFHPVQISFSPIERQICFAASFSDHPGLSLLFSASLIRPF
jgi:hypothetical protein